MTELEATRPKHENPWLVAVGSGAILLVLAALVGAIAKLPVSQIVAFIVGPMLLLGLAGLGLYGIVRARRTARERRAEFERLWERVDHLEARLARHALTDVVAEAIRRGWQIEHGTGTFDLTSPDDDVVTVDYWELDEHRVAAELHNASPHHYDENWVPPVVSMAASIGATAQGEIKMLNDRVERLENPTRGRALTEALARQRASIGASDRTSG